MTVCSICGGNGLLPFVKNGRVIPDVKLFCECRQEHEYLPRLEPTDFDFPMSYDFWRSICQWNGWEVPPSDKIEERKPDRVEHFQYQVKQLPDHEKQMIERMQGELKYLRTKLLEKEKGKRFPRKSSYD